MRTAEGFRADFLLDPGIVHLNHGSFGATPRPVLDTASPSPPRSSRRRR